MPFVGWVGGGGGVGARNPRACMNQCMHAFIPVNMDCFLGLFRFIHVSKCLLSHSSSRIVIVPGIACNEV